MCKIKQNRFSIFEHVKRWGMPFGSSFNFNPLCAPVDYSQLPGMGADSSQQVPETMHWEKTEKIKFCIERVNVCFEIYFGLCCLWYFDSDCSLFPSSLLLFTKRINTSQNNLFDKHMYQALISSWRGHYSKWVLNMQISVLSILHDLRRQKIEIEVW